MSTLKLTLLQQPLVWMDGAANLGFFEQLLNEIHYRDLIVLPEMFTSGFAMEAATHSLSENDVVTWMRQQAAKTNAMLAGSAAVQKNGAAVNRFYCCEPDGQIHFYDKRHLFRMAGEHQHYQAGNQRTVIEWRGWRILLQICYDLRFPVFSRNRNDYDLALYVANWPEARIQHWQTLLQARAIENQSYVAGCNRTGEDPKGHIYSGDSLILGPQGEILTRAEPHHPARLDADLSLEVLRHYREVFPAWQDADDFDW